MVKPHVTATGFAPTSPHRVPRPACRSAPGPGGAVARSLPGPKGVWECREESGCGRDDHGGQGGLGIEGFEESDMLRLPGR